MYRAIFKREVTETVYVISEKIWTHGKFVKSKYKPKGMDILFETEVDKPMLQIDEKVCKDSTSDVYTIKEIIRNLEDDSYVYIVKENRIIDNEESRLEAEHRLSEYEAKRKEPIRSEPIKENIPWYKRIFK